MNLRSKNKVNPEFNMSSMTDIIFLLLIFFMLTSNFVTPSGLPVSLPSSESTKIVMQKISITITDDLQYFVNDKPVTIQTLPIELKALLEGVASEEGVVVLHIDKAVAVEHLVKVAGIANSLNAKITIAAQPSEN